jgi:two-component system, OmpR family, sensor kinase
METNAIRFEPRRIDLRALAAEAIHEAAVLGRPRHVSIEADVPAGSVVVEGDPQRLKQVLLIVLDNAIKYSKPNSPIQVQLTEAQGEAGVTVRNSSDGIMPEDLPHLFDRFYRGHGSATQAARGTGLGLPIAKWIAEMQPAPTCDPPVRRCEAGDDPLSRPPHWHTGRGISR